MPAQLYLLRTDPGLESEVRESLRSEPAVAESDVLFKGHVVARVRYGDGTEIAERIDAVDTVAAYP